MFPCENPEAPHIKTFVQQDLQLHILHIGQHIKVDIDAGAEYSTGVDISYPNSIINVNVQVQMYDIKIGLFKAAKCTEYRQSEEEVTSAIKNKNV